MGLSLGPVPVYFDESFSVSAGSLYIKAETEVRDILEHLEAQTEALRKILELVSPPGGEQ